MNCGSAVLLAHFQKKKRRERMYLADSRFS